MNTERKIIHVDMDAFYASVEQRDNPELQGKAVAVGGGSSRGVVMTASYEARAYGVRSAMPGMRARRLCPDVIFVPPRFEAYQEVSKQIRAIFRSYSELVEPLSMDEAFIDVTDPKRGPRSATLIARAIKDEIRDVTGVTATAGVSFNKFLAKTASGMNKPDGLTVILPQDAMEFLARLPIEKFHGVGAATAERFKKRGIHCGRDLQMRDTEELTKLFGKSGRYFQHLAMGRDNRPVVTYRERKSIAAERTFWSDINSHAEMIERLNEIAEKLIERMQRAKIGCRTITLKLRTSDFETVTRSKTVALSISTTDQLRTVAHELLTHAHDAIRPVRLLGLSATHLVGNEEGGELGLEFL